MERPFHKFHRHNKLDAHIIPNWGDYEYREMWACVQNMIFPAFILIDDTTKAINRAC